MLGECFGLMKTLNMDDGVLRPHLRYYDTVTATDKVGILETKLQLLSGYCARNVVEKG